MNNDQPKPTVEKIVDQAIQEMAAGLRTINIQRIFADATIPKAWSEEAAGFDLHAYIKNSSDRPHKTLLPPRTTRIIRTGWNIELPRNTLGMVCSRSGLAKNSIFVANAPGIIDPDYRGEICVLLYNGSHESQWIAHEDRIAQLVLANFYPARITELSELSPSARGVKGFGSTGV